MKADRRQRQLKILELIATHAIRTQEELAGALAREGWEVTQSSVSRDIAALGLVKVQGIYRPPAAAQRPRPDPDEQRIAEGVLAMEPAGDALLVVHTPPGEANRVGAALDRLAWPGVLGNISGDDTIFVALRNPAARRRVLATLRRLSGGLRSTR
jgi:transcriptional regulator of arginine metabolism